MNARELEKRTRPGLLFPALCNGEAALISMRVDAHLREDDVPIPGCFAPNTIWACPGCDKQRYALDFSVLERLPSQEVPGKPIVYGLRTAKLCFACAPRQPVDMSFPAAKASGMIRARALGWADPSGRPIAHWDISDAANPKWTAVRALRARWRNQGRPMVLARKGRPTVTALVLDLVPDPSAPLNGLTAEDLALVFA